MKDGHAGELGHVLAAGVDQVAVFLAFRRQWAVPDDAVFRMINDRLARVDIVGTQGGHADAQVDDPTVLELHRQPVAHCLPFYLWLVCHPITPNFCILKSPVGGMPFDKLRTNGLRPQPFVVSSDRSRESR